MPKRDDTLLLKDIFHSGLKIQRYPKGYSFQDFQMMNVQ